LLQVKQLEELSTTQTITIEGLRKECAQKQSSIIQLTQERNDLLKTRDDLQRSEDEIVRLKEEVSGHSSSRVELETELASNRDKAGELLAYSEKLATRNAELQSEMSALEIKVAAMTNEMARLNGENDEMNQQLKAVVSVILA
jgi:chromosome segregation ATPase